MHLRRLFSALASHCPSCSRPLATRLPACSQCGTIAPIPPSVGFHELFALPSRPNPFVVDQSLLKRRFREAQAACHPDSWVSKGQKQQDIAQNLSSQLNEAYNALASPLRRAEYILAQNGLPIGEADHLEDIELITEIMEVRESIDEAEDAERLSEIGAENDDKIGWTVGELERYVGAENWKGVKEAAIRLRYLESISSAVKVRVEECDQSE